MFHLTDWKEKSSRFQTNPERAFLFVEFLSSYYLRASFLQIRRFQVSFTLVFKILKFVFTREIFEGGMALTTIMALSFEIQIKY